MVQTNYSNWIISAIIYSSYNSILLIPILIGLNKYIKTKKEIYLISVISSVILIILGICILFLLLKVNGNIEQIEIPVLYAIQIFGNIFKVIYSMVILLSIFTTAISAGYGFLENISKNKKAYRNLAIIICVLGIPISKIGFSNLVNLMYPIFGYLGIAQLFMILNKKA